MGKKIVIQDVTGTHKGHIATYRLDGESDESYKARRVISKMQLNGYWDKYYASKLNPKGIWIKGHKQGASVRQKKVL